MARKEPENFYRRQQEEANRIATKQHRALVDLVRLAKSSNEELRKMRRAFEAFTEAVNDMKVEPFKLQAFTATRAEADLAVKIAEGEHPPPLFDAKAFKEALDRDEAPVVPEGEPYPEVHIEPDHSKKRVEARTQRAPRLGFGDVVEATGAMEVTPDDDRPGFTVNLNADLTSELPMHSMTDVPVELNGNVVGTADIFEDGTASVRFTDPEQIPAHHGELDLFWKYKLADEAAEGPEEVMGEGGGEGGGDRDAMFACPSDCALDHEHIAAHGSDPDFWHEPEEECADVSEARRTPQGYAAGGYTGVSYWATEEEQERLGEGPSKFGVPINQLAGIVHPGELWGTAEQLQHMRDLGLIADGIITHETDAQLDMDWSQGRE